MCNNIINALRTVSGHWQSNWCHTAAPGASALAGINARSLLLSCMPLRALGREVASPLLARITLHMYMQLQLQLHVQLRAARRSCTRRGDDMRSGASTPTGINARALLQTLAGALPGVCPPVGRRAQAAMLCTCAYYATGRAVMAGARSLACVFADAQVPSRAHGWDWSPGSIDAVDGPPRMRSSSSFMVTAWRMRVPAGDLLIIIEI